MDKHTDNLFFVAGGTMDEDVPSYIQRQSDHELLQMAAKGEFCYVLTPRQMGKSSLMTRTAKRLQEQGIKTAIVDLNGIGGNVKIEPWYLSVVSQISYDLRLNVDYVSWWEKHENLSVVQRFSNFLRDVILDEVTGRLVIFIDEIDSTLTLKFKDDFFAAIRAIYNARAKNPRLSRLSFVLLGVASPSDLIEDVKRTPFNIGHGISLKEFTPQEAEIFRNELNRRIKNYVDNIFDRIFYWANGHPFLTQKLCFELVNSKGNSRDWTDENIDDLVYQLFFTDEGRKDPHIQYVQGKILERRQALPALKIYSDVLHKKKVVDNVHSLAQNQLKLSGVIKIENGHLKICNRIYENIFDEDWVKEKTPINSTKILIFITILLGFSILVLLGVLAYDAYIIPQQANNQIANFFQNKENPQVRVKTLATLFRLRPIVASADYESSARDLFFGLTREEQLNLFNPYFKAEINETMTVIKELYVTFADVDNDDNMTPLLEGMRDMLTDSALSSPLKNEITTWILGRKLYRTNNMKDARLAYDSTISQNGNNPATRFERARVLIQLGETNAAISDLQQVVSLAKNVPNPTPTPSLLLVATLTRISLTTPTDIQFTTKEPSALGTITLPLNTETVIPVITPTIINTPVPIPTRILSQSYRSKFENAIQIKSAVASLITNDKTLIEFINKNNEFSTLRLLLPSSLSETATPAPSDLTRTPTSSPAIIASTTPIIATSAIIALVNTPTASPIISSTLIPRPTPTPTIRITTVPAAPTTTPIIPTTTPIAPTATSAPSLSLPTLISPATNATLSSSDNPTFSWTSAGNLGTLDYYQFNIQHSLGTDIICTKSTSSQARSYVPTLSGGQALQWSVAVVRLSAPISDGVACSGTTLVSAGETRSLNWTTSSVNNPQATTVCVPGPGIKC